MALLASVGRIGTTVLDMLHTRLELAAVEIEEESKRALGYFVMALVSLILFGIALLLVALTIILVFWDTYRVQAALGVTVLFAAAGAITAFKLRASLKSKPRLLAATVGEFKKDMACLTHREPSE